MKRLLLILVILVLSVVFLVGCGGVIPEPPPEIPLELIREYTKYDEVRRWADGVISVYDETSFEGLQGILDKINTAIDGPVVFQLSDNPNAQIKVIFEELVYYGSTVHIEFSSAYEITNVLIRINPSWTEYSVYLQAFLVSLSINLSESDQGITQKIKTVLYWLYRLEPSYPLT